MTPEEKAKYLYDKFFDINVCKEHHVCEYVAKKCVEITIQEIELSLSRNYIPVDNKIEAKSYWSEVKSYIELQ